MGFPIYTGAHGNNHIQGITVDKKKGFLYYSFTTKLVKATLEGKIVGSVGGLTGHLGCIDFCEEDGRVYGSLEYKSDAIGKGIRKSLGVSTENEDAFYIAVFDVDKIDRMDMDAQKDGIMTAVYLREVAEDYQGVGTDANGDPLPHKYGCSGIDGTAFGPMPGSNDGKTYLFVAYGVYSDLRRQDNDHQVLLCYDTASWKQYEKPLSENAMHKSGPEAPLRKFFVYTGNTEYGVQNLEYDPDHHCYLMAVYPGKKPAFPNYRLYAVDAAVPPRKQILQGLQEEGEALSLAEMGLSHESTGIRGWNFSYGSTGLCALGNGEYLASVPFTSLKGQCAYIHRFVYSKEKDTFLLADEM